MIRKHDNYENGYYFVKDSAKGFNFAATSHKLKEILESYGDNFKCIICNSVTARNFKVTGGSVHNPVKSPITINNKLNDGCFFVNVLR